MNNDLPLCCIFQGTQPIQPVERLTVREQQPAPSAGPTATEQQPAPRAGPTAREQQSAPGVGHTAREQQPASMSMPMMEESTTPRTEMLLESQNSAPAAVKTLPQQVSQPNFVSLNSPNMSISVQDLSSLIQSLTQNNGRMTYDKNILPVFDPAQKNQRIESWIAKVNECAQIYKWTDEQTRHFALPKLEGHAKKWYEGLQTILLTWVEWQDRLIKAFPSETNHGSLLTEMLERRMKIGESVDGYYFDKMVLLNACEIKGKKAVDCLIHGIDDRTIRAGASSARLYDPEDLLKFLKDLCRDRESSFRAIRPRGSASTFNDIVCFKCNKRGHRGAQCHSTTTPELFCYNCKEKGHLSNKCSKPIVKCTNCNRVGHKTEDCYRNKNKFNNNNNSVIEKKTLFTQSNTSKNAKYHKEAIINGTIKTKCFVDFGSDCTLISLDLVKKHALNILQFNTDVPNVKGFGNGAYTPLGYTRIELTLGEVSAMIDAYIVENSMIEEPLLVGQDFTELPELLIVKTNIKLDIIKRDIPPELTNILTENDNNSEKRVLRVVSSIMVNKIDYVECSDSEKFNGDILVETTVRRPNNNDYTVLGGVYSLHEGGCKIAVCNHTDKPLPLTKGIVLARAEVINPMDVNLNNQDSFCGRIIEPSDLTPITEDDININPELTLEQNQSVVSLINKYRTCFAQNLSELGSTNIAEMNIELEDNTPVSYRPYRLSYMEREVVREMVKELIDNDIAEESNSPYASPIILVTKKTGGYRLCVDFRALNRKTKKDYFPMPRIDDQLDVLNGNKYYTSLDLASGYYQIPIRAEFRHLTAFITPDGLYQFKKMPLGLVNSPAVFQRTINKVLGNSRHDSTLAYMDDILIPGKDFEQEFDRLEKAFQLLQAAGLTLNLKKCNFFQETLEYLGHEISESGVRPGKAKITAVENFPTPRNVHEIRQFIGLASYFRKFIKNFSIIAKPLTDLTKKQCAWCWGAEQETAFNNLKHALIQRPLLGLYDPKNETFLHTDASKHGIAGILIQKDKVSGSMKPIAYFSRKTSIDEEKYHAYELETLAVVASLQRFRVYLLGVKFTLVTDCNALRATFTKRDLMPRIARWWIGMQEYNFDIVYRPGSMMSHVDALSRNPQPYESLFTQEGIPSIMRITQEDWLLSQQLADSDVQRIRKTLEDKESIEIKKNYVLKDNKLFRRIGDDLKWVVPKASRFQLCKLNHDDIGHFSVEKTLDKISKDFWFPKMKKFIRKYVHSCIECAYSKEPSGPKEGLLHPIHKVNKPFDTVHIDHLGPFVKSARGNSYLLVLVDGFTKFCLLKPLRNLKSNLSIRSLEEIFSIFGYPNRLISDQGSSFTSREFKRFCDKSKINHILNAVASPRANGQVERYNRTVLDALTAYTDKLGEKYWDTVLGKLQWGMNNTLNKGIGKAPSEALFGITMSNQGENVFAKILNETRQSGSSIQDIRGKVSEHIEKDQRAQKARYDRHKIKAKVYKEGDLVKLLKPVGGNDGKSKKLLPKFTGPYKITKVLENDRYEVSSIPGSKITQKTYCNIWAADRIKPWITTYSDYKSSTESDSYTDESD